MNTGEYITHVLSEEPDLSEQREFSIADEWSNYFTRQRLLGSIVTGDMNPDDLLDALSDHGRDVDSYLDSVDWALMPLI